MLRRRLLKYFILIIVASGTFLFACNKFDELKSPLNGFKVVIDYDIFDTFVSFRFIDAASGELIGGVDDEKVRISISGASAEAVVDQLGNHEKSYESVYGLLSLAINPKDEWVPTMQNQLNLIIDAESDEYKPAHLEVNIDSIGNYVYQVMMERTNVDALGIKTYTLNMEMDDEGRVQKPLNFSSTGGEVNIQIPEGTRFLNENGEIENSSEVTVTLMVYNKRNMVPVANTLLANVSVTEGDTKSMAVDLYKIVDISVLNGNSELITAPVDHPFTIRYKVDSAAFYPIANRKIQNGDFIYTYTYRPDGSRWEIDNETVIQSDSTGYFALSEIKSFSLHAAGMHTSLCELTGEMKFNLTGDFPSFPVPLRVYLYRKTDNSYISNVLVNVPESGFKAAINYSVPAETAVRLSVYQASNTNSFSASPTHFYYEEGCGNFGSLETTLTSTSVKVKGALNVNLSEAFPDEIFDINAELVNQSNNGVLWRAKYTIDKFQNEFEVNTSLPANANIYLRIVPVDNANNFEVEPLNYTMNTGDGIDQSWNFTITPINTRVKFNLELNRNDNFTSNDLKIRADITDKATKKVEKSLIFNVNSSDNIYQEELLLSNKKSYNLNLKRVKGSAAFMASPYEFDLGNTLQNEYNIGTSLEPVVKSTLTLNVKVVCPKSEIIPTLHGYYRTVWEDDWKECDIINGTLTIECELNATYYVGLIIEGNMEVTTYKFEEGKTDFLFELSESKCSKMGW